MKAAIISTFKYLLWAFTTCIVMSLAACSNDDPIQESKPIDPDDDNVEEVVLSEICTDWLSSPAVVAEKMRGYTLLGSSPEFASYAPDDRSFEFGYTFIDDKLVGSVALFPLSAETGTQDILSKYNFSSYKYMGNLEGYKVYLNISDNIMATISKREFNNSEYLALGFAPVSGVDFLPDAKPITVETLEATSVTTNSMTLNARFDCENEVSHYGFYVSKNQDMSDLETFRATVSGNTFSCAVSNLTYNTTYYIQAFIISNDEYYTGEVMSAELESVKTYSIGDFYPDANAPEGVVCSISDEGAHGTIISLDQSNLKWDEEGFFCTEYRCRNSYDGSKNAMGSDLPYMKWVKQHGDEWFGPARYQLKISKSDLNLINTTLSSRGYKTMNGMYWSSTEQSSNTAWVVTTTETSYLGYSNQHIFYNSKNQTWSVRAMKYF